MRIIVNATFLINTLRTEPSILHQLKLATIKNVADEIENELGTGLEDFNIEMIQIKFTRLEISNERKQRLSDTDINLLKTCYEHRNRCIMVSDDLQLKNTASENHIKCYTTPEFVAYLLRKGKIPKPQCIQFLNILKKIYIRPRDIDKVLKRIEG
jgi:predicted nucleic acid-binding protein